MSNHNQRICQIFEQLYKIRVAQGEEWRAKSYEKVIPLLRNYHKDIESGLEARQIPGIGDKLSTKIDEILRTGTLSELNTATLPQTPQDQEKEQVLQLFEKIEGVGPKTALKWYNTGYRKISDIPLSICTATQAIGVQLYHELIQRIPRTEMDQFNQIFHYYLDPMGIQFVICGSYRRGRADSGDVDVLLIARPDMNVLATVLTIPIFTHKLSYGDKKFLGVCKINQLHRRVDLELVQPYEYPFAVVYFTGSEKFNVLMRQRAIDLGVRLNEKSLTREIINEYGQKQLQYYQANTEEDVFSLLGIQYLTPEERDKY